MSTRTPGPLYRLDDRFHAGKIVTAGDDDGIAVCTFDEHVPTIIQENFLHAINAYETLRAENARLREALIYCKDHIEANQEDGIGSPAAGCYAAAKAYAALGGE